MDPVHTMKLNYFTFKSLCGTLVYQCGGKVVFTHSYAWMKCGRYKGTVLA